MAVARVFSSANPPAQNSPDLQFCFINSSNTFICAKIYANSKPFLVLLTLSFIRFSIHLAFVVNGRHNGLSSNQMDLNLGPLDLKCNALTIGPRRQDLKLKENLEPVSA